LLDLIPEGIRDPLQIPKTIIFHDRIHPGLSIARQLRAHLSRILSISDVSAKATIPGIFASVDAKAKNVGLFNFREGKARIMIALDHWGLKIDASDVERVIQWHVDEKLDFSDLDQRIGKAVANPNLEGTAIVYVQNGLLKAISKSWKKEVIEWEETWRQPDLFLDDDSSGDDQRYSDADDDDDDEEDGRTKRVWKQKPLGRFGRPVETDVQDIVALHRRYLYLQAKRARKAWLAEQERNRTGRKVKSPWKLDPGVLLVSMYTKVSSPSFRRRSSEFQRLRRQTSLLVLRQLRHRQRTRNLSPTFAPRAYRRQIVFLSYEVFKSMQI